MLNWLFSILRRISAPIFMLWLPWLTDTMSE